MAAKKRKKKATSKQQSDPIEPRKLIHEIVRGDGSRFTQDSPVLPEVWMEFADRPDEQLDLLVTPHYSTKTAVLAAGVRAQVSAFRERWAKDAPKSLQPKKPCRVAQSQSVLRARIYFEELVCVVLPMTSWWRRYIERGEGQGSWLLEQLTTKRGSDELVKEIESVEARDRNEPNEPLRLEEELLWVVRVVGTIGHIRTRRNGRRPITRPTARDIVRNLQKFAEFIGTATRSMPDYSKNADEELRTEIRDAQVWLVSRNRELERNVHKSTLAVKADAGRRLFEIDCSQITWAVIDTGVDAGHAAFVDQKALRRLLEQLDEAKRQAASDKVKREGKDEPEEIVKSEPVEALGTDDRLLDLSLSRVTRTYDFTYIGKLLDPATPLDEFPDDFADSLVGDDPQAKRRMRWREQLVRALESGRDVDWKLVENLISMPHEHGTYKAPAVDHGTHVAGILGGDSRPFASTAAPVPGAESTERIGMCPDIRIFDLRVFPEQQRDRKANEFGLVAAVQFVRYLNSQHDYKVVHGVNLSLSVPHDVTNYACGRTPICEECNRTVNEGVVVVAAAGNKGFAATDSNAPGYGTYSSTTITDPGNAENVITVGSTHRTKPHLYGVSYFSSRGPTGDGRIKPDLVAPGEKVWAPSLHSGWTRKDGTSMAAPHVSGAAALLMARHTELIGEPLRIKQILCKTATDLGRESYFQGCGLVDALRALQSI